MALSCVLESLYFFVSQSFKVIRIFARYLGVWSCTMLLIVS